MSTGEKLAEYTLEGANPSGLAFAPDGRSFVATSGAAVLVAALGQTRERRVLGGRIAGLEALAMTPDGGRCAAAIGPYVVWWDLGAGRPIRVDRADASVADLDSRQDGTVLTVAAGNDVEMWNVPEGELLATAGGHAQTVRAVAFDPRGRYLASGGTGGDVIVRSSAKGKP